MSNRYRKDGSVLHIGEKKSGRGVIGKRERKKGEEKGRGKRERKKEKEEGKGKRERERGRGK